VLLDLEQKSFFGVTQYNILPLIRINNVYYDENINIRWVFHSPVTPRDFVRFGCNNGFFDCRMFRFLRKIIIIVLFILTLLCIGVFMFLCRRLLRRKMDNEMDLKVKEAVQKYLVVEKV
jgi:hypothetical protein